MRIPAALLLACLAASGCWSAGQVRYRDHPELAGVKLASGEKIHTPPEHLGVVRTRVTGYQSCDSLVTEAFRDLLAESRALGGSGVRDVKFRRRWHWSGREPMCKSQLVPPFRLAVEAQGLATR